MADLYGEHNAMVQQGTQQHYKPASKQHREDLCRVLGCTVACVHFYKAALSSKWSKGTEKALQTLPCGQPRKSWPQRSTFGRLQHSKAWFSAEVTWCHDTQRRDYSPFPESQPLPVWCCICLLLVEVKKKKKSPNLFPHTKGCMQWPRNKKIL